MHLNISVLSVKQIQDCDYLMESIEMFLSVEFKYNTHIRRVLLDGDPGPAGG